MKKHFILSIFVVCLGMSLTASGAYADPIDLSGWTPVTLDFAGGQGAANWQLGSGNTAVTQTINADPSFYLNNVNQTGYTMQGSWRVLTTSDDDYMGFAFGYQNSSNFYLFDWKQAAQGYEGGTAAEGMTIKKFQGATGSGLADLSLRELWENVVSFGDMTVLATNHGTDKGWADNVQYDFYLDYKTTSGVIRVVVKQGTTELWNVTVNDATFGSGQFGFYNYSQEQVNYAGFEQTTTVPEPVSFLLVSLGLVGLAGVRRFRK